MSDQINQDMKAAGVAQVLVFLKPDADKAASSVKANIGDHFRKSEFSITSAVAAGSPKLKASSSPAMRYYPNLGVALGTVDREGLAALRADKANVDKVSGTPPLRLIRPREVTAASLTSTYTWGLKTLEIKDLWDQGLSGKDVIVGHLDTGVDGGHPALKNALFDFTEFDELGKEINPKPKAYDSGEHGTHTAATILGRSVGGKYIGVAPKAKLASAMVIEGGNAVARVIGGMDWAVGKGIKVLSMSLGFPGWLPDFMGLTRIIRARGILPVFAIGNEYAGYSRSPGNYWQALSVGACNEQMEVADFSSSQLFNRKKDPIAPDLVAPGVSVISAKPGGGYQAMDGTSMATPHIAGLAALLWEAKPTASVSEIENAIYGSCQLLPTMSQMRANRGLPNGPRALSLL
jgi:subtilisin family serine protease